MTVQQACLVNISMGIDCLSRSGRNFNTSGMKQMFSLEENTSFGLYAPGVLMVALYLERREK